MGLLTVLELVLRCGGLRTCYVIRPLLVSGVLGLSLLAYLDDRRLTIVLECCISAVPALDGTFLPRYGLLDRDVIIDTRLLRTNDLLIMRLVVMIVRLALRDVIEDSDDSEILCCLSPLLTRTFLILIVMR